MKQSFFIDNLTFSLLAWKPWETNQGTIHPSQRMVLDCDEDHADAKPYGIEVCSTKCLEDALFEYGLIPVSFF